MDKVFIKTCLGKNNKIIPKWFMRQAGRYLPEYMEVRNGCKNFLDLCYTPKKACEVTIQPLDRFNFDAAIIFSDILVIPDALGIKVDFIKGQGPKLQSLLNDKKVSDLKFNIKHLDPVYEAIDLTKSKINASYSDKSLIGFAGAPWTLATYMIAGSGVKDYNGIKKWIYENPEDFSRVLDLLIDSTTEHLIKQIDAGCEAIQIFDSWAGVLNPQEFYDWSIFPIKKIVKNIKKVHPKVPVIGFPKGAGVLYKAFAKNVGVDVLSIDQNLPISWALDNIDNVVLQGNLDPLILAVNLDRAIEQTKFIMMSLKGRAHVFNLGHGILPFTPPDNVSKVIEVIDNYRG